MGGIRILKFTNYIENALCIYRNFCYFGINVRALIITRIVVELLFIIAHVIIRSNYYFYHPQCKTEVTYFYMTSFNSVALIIFGCCYSKGYKSLTSHLHSGCNFFDSDNNYLKRLQTQHIALVASLMVFLVVKGLLFSYVQLSSESNPVLPTFWHYFFQINMLTCDFRYIFEFLVLYCVLHVMSEQLQVVTRSIDTKNMFENNSHSLISEVDKWSFVYKHIRESAKLFNYTFGIQLTVMLASSMFYYIILLYAVASESVAGKVTMRGTSTYLTTLVLMLCILCMVARAAQRMENSADVLRRRLCKMLILCLTNDECYKVTKDLLRMMSTRPIRARAFGSISVDMTLLPTCISFFTSYTYISKQNRHICRQSLRSQLWTRLGSASTKLGGIAELHNFTADAENWLKNLDIDI